MLILFPLLFLVMGILTSIIFPLYSCKTLYFILDTLIMGIFFFVIKDFFYLSSLIDSFFEEREIIYSFYRSYMFIRFLILLRIFIGKKLAYETINFNSRGALQRILIFFNSIINIITIYLILGPESWSF